MKNSLFIVLLFCLVFVLTSKSQNPKLNYKVKESFEITNGNIIGSYNSTLIFYKEKDKRIILALSKDLNEIDVFDINSHKYINKIALSSKPKLIMNNFQAEDFYILNADSIIVLSPQNNKIAIIDINGNLKSVINLNPAVEDYQSDIFFDIETSSFFGNISFDKRNNNLLIRSIPPLNWDIDKNFYKAPFISVYSLNSKKFIQSFGHFPEYISMGDDYLPNEFQCTFIIDFSKNRYIVSNKRDHYLYEYELYTDNLNKKKLAKSNYLSNINLSPRKFNSQEIMNSLIKTGQYLYILQNKYLNEFYRIVQLNQDLKDQKTGRLNHPVNRPFSIIVLDNNLNVIGECLFKDTKYLFFNLVPIDQGLLFIYQDEEIEDKFHFDIVDFY